MKTHLASLAVLFASTTSCAMEPITAPMGETTAVSLEQALPRQRESTYYQVMGRQQVLSGPIPYAVYFGQGIPGGKLTGLQNPSPLLSLSIVKAGATNQDCWTSNAITLGPGQWTTSEQIQRLYGSSQPTLPIGLMACVNSTAVLDAIGINIKYLHD